MPIRGEAECRLADGRVLTLKVNFATLARVAVQTDVPAKSIFDVLKDKADPRQLTVGMAMLEQALRVHHPDIDEEAVGDLMLTDENALAAALGAAALGAFGPEGKQGSHPPRPPRKTGTSTNSRARGRKPA